ncbi:MAG: DsbA family protein [Pseudomonadota bacterium]
MTPRIAAGLTALTLTLAPFGLSAPAAAQESFDFSSMSAAESAAFGEAVRSYLLENPEVLMEAIGILESRQELEAAQRDEELVATHAASLFGDDHSWVGGAPEGDITVVEFIDYRCGFCRRAHPEVQELIATDGRIRLIVKEFPILGEQSVLASRFAIAVKKLGGDEAYKAAHDALIEMPGDVNELALELLAVDLGLDPAAVLETMGTQEVTDIILANRTLAQQLEIRGTPTFVVGDTMLRGYVPLDGMREVVAAERAEG